MTPYRSHPVLLVRTGGLLCALPVGDVIETMRPLPVEPLAEMPDFVRGVAMIRGNPTPVVALQAVLAKPSSEESGRFVTVRVGERCVALTVQSVVGVATLNEDNLESMPPLLKAARTDVIQAVSMLDSELLVLLRTARLVPEAIWQAIDKSEAAAR